MRYKEIIKENREQTDKEINRKSRYDDDDWITINGTHVCLNEEGEATKGPEKLREHINKNASRKENPKSSTQQKYIAHLHNIEQKYGKASSLAELEKNIKEARGLNDSYNGDVIAEEIYKELGYLDKPANVAPWRMYEVAMDGGMPIYRGIAGDENHSAAEYRRAFVEGTDKYISRVDSLYGEGTYFDVTANVATEYSDGTDNSTITAVLPKEAKVISLDEIMAMQQEDEKNGEKLEFGGSDFGIYAALKGYDAIHVQGEYTGSTHVVVLNRSKLLVCKEEFTQPLRFERDIRVRKMQANQS